MIFKLARVKFGENIQMFYKISFLGKDSGLVFKHSFNAETSKA